MSGIAWRVLRELAAHPDGLSTPALADLTGEPGADRTLVRIRCGNVLRRMERDGIARRAGTVPGARRRGTAVIWQLAPGVPAAPGPDYGEPLSAVFPLTYAGQLAACLLHADGRRTLGDLLSVTTWDLIHIPMFDGACLGAVKAALASRGLPRRPAA